MKSEIEHKDPIFLRIFNLQCAKLTLMEPLNNFFTKFYHTVKDETFKVSTNSISKLLEGKCLYSFIREENRPELIILRRSDSEKTFTADACCNFYPDTCCLEPKKTTKKTEVWKEEFLCTVFLFFCSKMYVFYDSCSNKYHIGSKQLSKGKLETVLMVSVENIGKLRRKP